METNGARGARERENFDYQLKVIVIGNMSSGKSSVVHYFMHQKSTLLSYFSLHSDKKNVAQTVGVEFVSKLVKVNDKSIKV
jgi:GTPase SAR1 family protein